jgi:hypothetical protein
MAIAAATTTVTYPAEGGFVEDGLAKLKLTLNAKDQSSTNSDTDSVTTEPTLVDPYNYVVSPSRRIHLCPRHTPGVTPVLP